MEETKFEVVEWCLKGKNGNIVLGPFPFSAPILKSSTDTSLIRAGLRKVEE